MPRGLAGMTIHDLQAELAKRAKKVARQLNKLIRQRDKLNAQIAELEGLVGPMKAKPGPKPGKPKAVATMVRRKRGTFKQTATELILGMVKGKGATTSGIRKKWAEAGRGGKADNTLTKLVADGTLKRIKLPTGKGSTYTVA